MKSRHFLKIQDYTPEEIKEYIDLAAKLKADKKAGREVKELQGKNIAILFEKASTPDAASFSIASLSCSITSFTVGRISF